MYCFNFTEVCLGCSQQYKGQPQSEIYFNIPMGSKTVLDGIHAIMRGSLIDNRICEK